MSVGWRRAPPGHEEARGDGEAVGEEHEHEVGAARGEERRVGEGLVRHRLVVR